MVVHLQLRGVLFCDSLHVVLRLGLVGARPRQLQLLLLEDVINLRHSVALKELLEVVAAVVVPPVVLLDILIHGRNPLLGIHLVVDIILLLHVAEEGADVLLGLSRFDHLVTYV